MINNFVNKYKGAEIQQMKSKPVISSGLTSTEPFLKHRIKLCFVIFQFVKWAIFEWIAKHLDRTKFDVTFILLFNGKSPLAKPLSEMDIPFYEVQYAGNSDRIKVGFKIFSIYRKIKPDIVHTHFQPANITGLIAAWVSRVPVRIHTRHHAGPYPPSHKFRTYKRYDKINSLLSTHIVAISSLVKEVLGNEGTPENKIQLVRHGFDIEQFDSVSESRINALREQYIPEDAGPVIGIVSRYQEWKGLEYSIPAFKKLLKDFPTAFLILANAWGPDSGTVKKLLSEIPSDRYVEIKYEDDVYALFKLFNVFVHTPIEPHYESFGQVYIEALIAGVPSVCTKSGIALEFSEHKESAYLVDHQNENQIVEGIKELLKNIPLQQKIRKNGRKIVENSFNVEGMINAFEELYLSAAPSAHKF